MSSERIDLANETTRRIFNTEFPAVVLPGEPDSAADLRRLFNEHAFADSWTRTALDDKTRSIVTVAVLTALGGTNKLRGHIGGAISLGVTPDELVDLFIHIGVYAGVPRASDGWDVASDLLAKKAAREARAREAASQAPVGTTEQQR